MTTQPLNSFYRLIEAFMRIVIALLLSIVSVSPAFADQKLPEKLVYSLSWTGISVGTAIQEISEDRGERRIVSRARSNDWLSAFYPVDDRTESLLDKVGDFPGKSKRFRMAFKEGTRSREYEIDFDHAAGRARYMDRKSGESADVRLEPETFDIYSSFYFVRHQDLVPGTSIQVRILDGRQVNRIEVRVLKREKIKVPAGEFRTILVEPMVKAEGVFEGKRGLRIWLTDDARRIPVKVQTKVTVGSVTALLTGGSFQP